MRELLVQEIERNSNNMKREKSTAIQYGMLIIGVGIASLCLGNQYMFYLVGLLPLIGLYGYMVTKKVIVTPALVALWLAVAGNVKEIVSALRVGEHPGDLFGYMSMSMLWFGIFIIFVGLGSILAYMLHMARNVWKSKEKHDKVFSGILYVVGVLIIVGIGAVYSGFNGNPISKMYATYQMHQYMEATYPDHDYTLRKVGYNFKSTGYGTDAVMYVDGEERDFYIRYGRGRVSETYYSDYLEDKVKSRQLAKQAAKEIEVVLEAHAIPFYAVDTQISVPITKYDGMSYNKDSVTELLDISIYKYTEDRESPEVFGKWCEAIREVLVDAGYPIDTIQMDSDPHFMIARLGLSIRGEELHTPIQDIKKYRGYTDYAEINGYGDLSEEEWEEAKLMNIKDGVIPDKDLSLSVAGLLESLPLEIIDVEVYNYDEGVSIRVEWTGEDLEAQTFAEQCVAIRELIEANKDILGDIPIYEMSFTYVKGSASEHWYYDCYSENMDIDAESIAKQMLADDKLRQIKAGN